MGSDEALAEAVVEVAGADGEFASAFAGGYFDEATSGIPTEGGGAISHYSWSTGEVTRYQNETDHREVVCFCAGRCQAAARACLR